MSNAPTTDWADRAGMVVAVVCLVHCMALPIVLALLPAVAAMWGGPWVHIVLVGLAVPISGFALLRGVLRHRDLRVMLLGSAGLLTIVGVVLAGVALWLEVLVMLAGTGMLMSAHLRNLSLGH